jgi:hypothetical protein
MEKDFMKDQGPILAYSRYAYTAYLKNLATSLNCLVKLSKVSQDECRELAFHQLRARFYQETLCPMSNNSIVKEQTRMEKAIVKISIVPAAPQD